MRWPGRKRPPPPGAAAMRYSWKLILALSPKRVQRTAWKGAPGSVAHGLVPRNLLAGRRAGGGAVRSGGRRTEALIDPDPGAILPAPYDRSREARVGPLHPLRSGRHASGFLRRHHGEPQRRSGGLWAASLPPRRSGAEGGSRARELDSGGSRRRESRGGGPHVP